MIYHEIALLEELRDQTFAVGRTGALAQRQILMTSAVPVHHQRLLVLSSQSRIRCFSNTAGGAPALLGNFGTQRTIKSPEGEDEILVSFDNAVEDDAAREAAQKIIPRGDALRRLAERFPAPRTWWEEG